MWGAWVCVAVVVAAVGEPLRGLAWSGWARGWKDRCVRWQVREERREIGEWMDWWGEEIDWYVQREGREDGGWEGRKWYEGREKEERRVGGKIRNTRTLNQWRKMSLTRQKILGVLFFMFDWFWGMFFFFCLMYTITFFRSALSSSSFTAIVWCPGGDSWHVRKHWKVDLLSPLRYVQAFTGGKKWMVHSKAYNNNSNSNNNNDNINDNKNRRAQCSSLIYPNWRLLRKRKIIYIKWVPRCHIMHSISTRSPDDRAKLALLTPIISTNNYLGLWVQKSTPSARPWSLPLTPVLVSML